VNNIRDTTLKTTQNDEIRVILGTKNYKIEKECPVCKKLFLPIWAKDNLEKGETYDPS